MIFQNKYSQHYCDVIRNAGFNYRRILKILFSICQNEINAAGIIRGFATRGFLN